MARWFALVVLVAALAAWAVQPAAAPAEIIQVSYHAAETMDLTKVELVNPAPREQVVRGFATALSGPVDYRSGVPRIPTVQELATGDRDYLQGKADASKRPPATIRDLSKADTPAPHGREICRLLQWYKASGDEAYLKAATEQARLACVRFMDDTCPLPKAHAGAPKKTVEGKPFGDFYFRGAKLMHAFALLGEARQ